MHENRIYTLICGVYECLKWGFMLKKGAWRGIFEKKMGLHDGVGNSRHSCSERKQL